MTKAIQTLALDGNAGSPRNRGLDVVTSSSLDLHRVVVVVETRSSRGSGGGSKDAMRSGGTTNSRQQIPAGDVDQKQQLE
ncbi:hypothetical protein ZWY2020_002652 [Hordeum vulgare]|nr:hypothetical protein ZWY2020_002652 [Hordeum vulgare]